MSVMTASSGCRSGFTRRCQVAIVGIACMRTTPTRWDPVHAPPRQASAPATDQINVVAGVASIACASANPSSHNRRIH
jgi:hypothetical protein